MELVKYDAMRLAIAEAHAVDEVKGIRDKAQALAEYAKQSRLSVDDINRCCEIKLRAERRAGELLAEVERAQGRRSDLAETSAQREPKSTLGEQVQELGVSLASCRRRPRSGSCETACRRAPGRPRRSTTSWWPCGTARC